MTDLDGKIAEKRRILRRTYGGMMTVTDLGNELGMKRPQAKAWAQEHGLGCRIGKRIKVETDEFARVIVEIRGMW